MFLKSRIIRYSFLKRRFLVIRAGINRTGGAFTVVGVGGFVGAVTSVDGTGHVETVRLGSVGLVEGRVVKRGVAGGAGGVVAEGLGGGALSVAGGAAVGFCSALRAYSHHKRGAFYVIAVEVHVNLNQ